MQCIRCGHSINDKNSATSCLYCGAPTEGFQKSAEKMVRSGAGTSTISTTEKICTGESLSEYDAVKLDDLPHDLRRQVLSALKKGPEKDSKKDGADFTLSSNVNQTTTVGALPGFEAGRRFSEEDIDLYFDQLRNHRKTPSKRRNQLAFLMIAVGMSVGISLFIL